MAIAVYDAVRKYRVVSVIALSRSATHVILWILVGFVVVQLHGLVEHHLQEGRHRLEHAQALLWPVMLLAFVAASIALKFVVDVLHEHAIDVFDHFFFRRLVHALDHLDGVADALESGDVADPQQIEAKITASATETDHLRL